MDYAGNVKFGISLGWIPNLDEDKVGGLCKSVYNKYFMAVSWLLFLSVS